jgi:hypothetical protein
MLTGCTRWWRLGARPPSLEAPETKLENNFVALIGASDVYKGVFSI